jgi:UDP-N-acetylmuramoyl-L-alanyl-D-glutamate--2,6-diaminopimelate ligase
MDINKILNSIDGITNNSKDVARNYLFFALPGLKLNGEDYIEDAINRGAKFIVVDINSKADELHKGAEFIKVEHPWAYLSKFSSLFYKYQPENIVAVTGTNGKTSVANFFQQICDLNGYKSASIGTLGLITSEKKYESKETPSLTSPGPIELHKTLRELYDKSYMHVAMEASSHGIYQNRLDSVNFKAAGFTNFTQDHLDYHKTLEEYLKAKLRLFKEVLQPERYAVLNSDIPEFETIKKICENRSIRVLEYGKKAQDLQIISSSFDVWEVNIFGKKYEMQPIVKGEFQLYNVLCSVGLAVACGLEISQIMSVIEKLTAARGRLELAAKHNDADVYIDYAHTPDSLQTILVTLRKICKGQLHVVFGCGGERDSGKRAMMGDIAGKYADFTTITDDNPRSEEPSNIRKQIMSACSNGVEIAGRSKAIKYAMDNLKPHDILVIAGKGHEDYQLIGSNKIHFSDFDEVKRFANSTPNSIS